MTGLRRTRKRFKKPCRICGKMFRPIGLAETLCEKCYYKVQRKNVKSRKTRGKTRRYSINYSRVFGKRK